MYSHDTMLSISIQQFLQESDECGLYSGMANTTNFLYQLFNMHYE